MPLGQRRRVVARRSPASSRRSRASRRRRARLLGRHVAQHALREVQVLVQQRRRRDVERAGVEVAPELGQVLDVVLHLALGGGLGHRADDEAAGRALRQQVDELVAQALALGLVLDALRDADVRILRQVDEQAPGER